MFLNKHIHAYVQRYGARETYVQDQLRLQTHTMPEHKMRMGPDLAHILCFFINTIRADRILEIGTRTGYCSLAMALNTPDDAKIVTCDNDHESTKMGQQYWHEAGVAHKIFLRLGDAQETMRDLITKWKRFDFIFINADKKNYSAYFDLAQKLLRPGGLIAMDNTLLGGEVADEPRDEMSNIMHELNTTIQRNRQFDFILLPVGEGLTLVRKNV